MATRLRQGVLGLAGAAGLGIMVGCSPPPPVETPPPPPPRAEAPPPPLLGGPPGDQTPAGTPDANGLITLRIGGKLVTAMRPIANPLERPGVLPRAHHRKLASKGAHRIHAQAAPVAAQAAAKPATVPIAKPLASPAVSPNSVVLIPLAPSTDPRLAALQSKLGPILAQGAGLSVAQAIAQGQPGPVALTLPPSLLVDLQREAARHGLGHAAHTADLVASLSGTGYQITPNGVQTLHLEAGKAASFNWRVVPAAGATGPLQANLQSNLTGGPRPLALPLAGLQARADRAAEALAAPVPKALNLPGLGAVPVKSLAALILILAGIGALIFAARRAEAEQQAEDRKRRLRNRPTFAVDPGFGERDDPPAPTVAAENYAAATVLTDPHAGAQTAGAPVGGERTMRQVIADAVADLRKGETPTSPSNDTEPGAT